MTQSNAAYREIRSPGPPQIQDPGTSPDPQTLQRPWPEDLSSWDDPGDDPDPMSLIGNPVPRIPSAIEDNEYHELAKEYFKWRSQ